jgi:hypothetical protein
MYGMHNPKEARKIVSDLSKTLKKVYDDAVIAGAEQTKQEIVLNMLRKNIETPFLLFYFNGRNKICYEIIGKIQSSL